MKFRAQPRAIDDAGQRPARGWTRLIAIAFMAVAGPAQSTSLCSPEEKVIFSCKTEHGLVSLCASANLSASSGYLQYRSGRDALTVEFEYPKQKLHPTDLFAFSNKGDRARASVTALQFVAEGQHHSLIAFRSASSGVSLSLDITALGGTRYAFPCAPIPISYERLLNLQALDLPQPDFMPDGS